MSPSASIEELGAGLETCYTDRRTGDCRRHHAVRAMLLLPERIVTRSAAARWAAGSFGNTINGAWAEYLLVPDARPTSRRFRRASTDEDVLMCPDIFSTGLAGAESGNIKVGDTRRGVRAGPDRPVRDARREAQRRGAHHRHRRRCRRASRPRAGSAPTSR